MTNDIDRLMARAAIPTSGPALGDLEASVWRRVEHRLEQRRVGQVRVAALVVALGVGVANGGLLAVSTSAPHSDLQAFSVSEGLSPVSILGLAE